MDELLKKAEDIATEAHAKQIRWGGEPYIDHPRAVAAKFTDPIAKMIAWLHDVIEDTYVTAKMLAEFGFPDEVVYAVKLLTHKKGESYLDYLIRIKRAGGLAYAVKLADIDHNLSTSGNRPSRQDKWLMARWIMEH